MKLNLWFRKFRFPMFRPAQGQDKLSYVKPASVEDVGEKKKDEYVIAFAGNSITRHGVNDKTIRDLGWARECGMAASCEKNDYAHLLAELIQREMPEKKVRCVFGTPKSPADLIVHQGGEHDAIPERLTTYEEQLEKRLEEYRKITPAVIVIGIWNPRCREEFNECTDKNYDTSAKQIEKMQERVCAKLGIPFASVSRYENDPENTGDGKVAGVRWHPNDNGMRCYAAEAFKAFRKLK